MAKQAEKKEVETKEIPKEVLEAVRAKMAKIQALEASLNENLLCVAVGMGINPKEWKTDIAKGIFIKD